MSEGKYFSKSERQRFRPYPKYKASGVEWLGEIPEQWKFKRLKFLISEPLAYGANEAAELIDPDLPRFIRITDIRDDGRLRDDTFRSLPREIAIPHLLKDGDLLFARSGATVGKAFRYNSVWGTAAHAGYLIRARLDKFRIDSYFVHYFTQSDSYWNWIRSSLIQATIQNVSAERYSNLVIPVPVLDRQRSIVSFLDRETAKIDALIEKKERLIDLLQEKRTALIAHAVTKGLDPTVPMKDSGVEWLGNIPAHWEAKRLKLASFINMGQSPSSDIVNTLGEGLPFLQGNADFGKEHPTAQAFCPAPPKTAEFGDILLSVRAPVGALNLADQKYGIGRGLCAIRPNIQILERKFCHYVLQIARHQLDKIAKGSTYDAVSSPEVSCLIIPLPSIKEQHTLASFLDRETAKIDALVAKTHEAIDRLKEYRTALVSAAVTGKIDVRDN
jgi:type I restriction enzyme S subunit